MKCFFAIVPSQLCSCFSIWVPNIRRSSIEGTKDAPGNNSFHFREKKVGPWSERRWKIHSSTLNPTVSGSSQRSPTLKIILLTVGAIPSGEVNNPVPWHVDFFPALQNCLSPTTVKFRPAGIQSSPFLATLSVTAASNRQHTFLHAILWLKRQAVYISADQSM